MMLRLFLFFLSGILFFANVVCAEVQVEKKIVVLGVDKKAAEACMWDVLYNKLALELVEEAGCSVEFVSLPWKRALDYLRSGELGMITFLSKNKEREVYADYIGVSLLERAGLLVRKKDLSDYSSSMTMEHILKKTVGVQENVFYSEQINKKLDELGKEPSNLQYVVKHKSNISKVKNGYIDCAFIENVDHMKFFIQKNIDYSDLAVIELSFVQEAPVYFAMSKKLPSELRDRIKKSYKRLAQEGRIKQILKQWMGS